MSVNLEPDYLIIGAGYSGLTLGLRLAQAGKSVVLIEGDDEVGGLASDFTLSNGFKLERFYHHWFSHDSFITKLIRDLGLSNEVREYPSNTGMYYNKRVWKLSSPIDLLRFKALSFPDRLRLGVAILLVRKVKNWQDIENLSIREWLEPLCGKNAYKIVWEPLVSAKFSKYSEEVSAAWMWKKLVLRGSTRSKKGSEKLLYFEGGFGKLAREITRKIESLGGEVKCQERISQIMTRGNEVVGVSSVKGITYNPKNTIFTGEPSGLAAIIDNSSFPEWASKLHSVQYLANICLVLLLDRSLSQTYWLNVNDSGFPFVGVIEHTNLVSQSNYGNLHVVYLSRYISSDQKDYSSSDQEYLQTCSEALIKMFPEFDKSWIKEHFIWRTPFAQPITTKNYSQKVPESSTPYKNLFLNSMAQVYPEDRGTNYAVRNAELLVSELLNRESE